MADFDATRTMSDVAERDAQLSRGMKTVPLLAAIIAVFAAIATLFANHSSISGLAAKNEAILAMSKASDQYNYYESKRIKVQLNQALITAGLVSSAAGLKTIQSGMAKEDEQAKNAILPEAQRLQSESDDHYRRSERYMQAYEKYEVSATLFEVSIVLVSLSALAQNKVFLYTAGGATLIGIVFFALGWFIR